MIGDLIGEWIKGILIDGIMGNLSGAMRKRRIGTAKFFTLLLLLYHTSAKSQGIKQLMAGGGVVLIGLQLIPLLSGLFS